MWICQNCGTENEDNFKFCWSCGENRAKAEVSPEPPPTAKPKTVEKIPEPPKPVEKTPEVKEKPPVDDDDVSPVITRVNPRPKTQMQKFDDDDDVLPMLDAGCRCRKRRTADGRRHFARKNRFLSIAVRARRTFSALQIFHCASRYCSLWSVRLCGKTKRTFPRCLRAIFFFRLPEF